MADLKWTPIIYDEVAALGETERCVRLTDRQLAMLLSVVHTMKWPTRWVRDGWHRDQWTDAELQFMDEQTEALQAALLSAIHQATDCGALTESCETNLCTYYFLKDRPSFVTWAPMSPWRPTSAGIPLPYLSNVWEIQTQNVPALGLLEGDIFVSPGALPLGFDVALYILNGFPRFNFYVEGAEEVEIEFLSVPQGGAALVSVDSFPLEIVDLQSLSLLDVNSWLDAMEDVIGQIQFGQTNIANEVLLEIPLPSIGRHRIDVTFIPRLSVDLTEIGFGGGIRRIGICGDNAVGIVNTEFRLNGCNLEYRNQDDEPWVTVGDVCGPPGADGADGVNGIDGQAGPAGADGQNAPIPIFEWGTGDDEYKLLIDADADGTPDYISPVLRGPQGAQGIPGVNGVDGQDGADGQDGQNCECSPVPTIPSAWPQPDEKDGFCYAAQVISRNAQDDLSDIAEIVDLFGTTLLEGVENLLQAVVSTIANALSIGIAGDAVDAIIEIPNEAVASPAIDFFRQNIRDIDAASRAAEMLYCGMRAAHDAGDFENLTSYVKDQFFSDQLNLIASLTSPGEFVLSGLGAAVDLIYNTGNGTYFGDLIIAFLLVSHEIIDQVVDVTEPLESTIAGLIQKAEYFDDRDCSTYGCNEDNPHGSDFVATWNFPLTHTNDILIWSQPSGGNFANIESDLLPVGSGFDIVAIEVMTQGLPLQAGQEPSIYLEVFRRFGQSSSQEIRYWPATYTWDAGVMTFIFPQPEPCFLWEIYVRNLVSPSNQGGLWSVQQIRIFGNGTNPYQDCEEC